MLDKRDRFSCLFFLSALPARCRACLGQVRMQNSSSTYSALRTGWAMCQFETRCAEQPTYFWMR